MTPVLVVAAGVLIIIVLSTLSEVFHLPHSSLGRQ